MGDIERIFKIKEPISHTFSSPQRQNPEDVEDYSVKKVVLAREIVTGNHSLDPLRPQTVNVIYGTADTPPIAATDVPLGTLYIQYLEA